jgi:hypothetical protein
MDSDPKKQDILALFEIRHLIEKGSTSIVCGNGGGSINKIYSELDAINKKFEELRDFVAGVKKGGSITPRKNAVKKEIISLLQKHKRLTSAQLGKIIGLSRVRANEYMREMEDERITKGVTIKKKKFYMLESDLVGKLYTPEKEMKA